ncbi:hypothetical protein ACIBF6_25065 [Streptosporangium amethystogenes]
MTAPGARHRSFAEEIEAAAPVHEDRARAPARDRAGAVGTAEDAGWI